ncbi:MULTISPECIES: FAD-dependent oxidoreductase [Rhodomicrobium]|uniref:NAD(P)/FAD-dependent oxidoreductase n=1 Tax=Rhodomicrobium TaxID=1068 RepID=UPI000B4C0368|nr:MULTISPECIES: FAD-dependent oxidoreductase [Rhodomicrobium]
MTKSIVVVGNGMASVRFLQEFFARDVDAFAVTVIGAEPEAGYNRILLSPMLAGEIAWADVQLRPAEWYADLGIELVTGDEVVTLDPAGKSVTCASGLVRHFDACVLATGSDPIRLPVPGANLPGVVTFRTAADVAVMLAAARAGAPAVVIGGGLLGIEAAYGLAKLGIKVTLIHLMDRLMERQLDAEAAALLADALRAKGIELLLGAQTAAISGQGAVACVTLKDGRELPCGLVVMAAGVRPRTGLGKSAGLAVNRGILIDDRLATSRPGIYAIGECAEHRGACYGLVEPAYEQAATLAGHLCGEAVDYAGSVPAANLKVSGVPVFSAGDFEGIGAEAIILRDDLIPAYRKLVIRDGRLAGAILYGDTDDSFWYLDLIRSGAPLGARRAMLAFGQAYAEAA